MFCLNIDELDKDKLVTVIKETTHSRIPVYQGDDDNFIGILHVKSFVEQYLEDPNKPLEKYLQNHFLSQVISI